MKRLDKLDWSQFYGSWYERQTLSLWDSIFQKCITRAYYTDEQGLMLKRVTTAKLFHIAKSFEADVVPVNGDSVVVHKYKNIFNLDEMSAPIWILGTDYSNYAVLWSCENHLFNFYSESIWILSRQQTTQLSPEVKQNISIVLQANGLAKKKLLDISQEGCY